LLITTGREYDKSGVLQPWWGKESIARFKQRAQCFDDQYSAYTAYGENVLFIQFFMLEDGVEYLKMIENKSYIITNCSN